MLENNNNTGNETNEFVYSTPVNTHDNNEIPSEIKPEKKKKGKAKRVIKTIALICAVGLISAGSIAGYKYVDENGIPFISEKKEDKKSAQINDEKNENSESEDSKESDDKIDIDRTKFKNASLLTLKEKENAMSTQAIYQKVMPAVVGISSTFEYQDMSYGIFGGGQTGEAVGTGTGIIMSEDGYILTNAHVVYSDGSEAVQGTAKDVSVVLQDESKHKAQIVGYDEQADIAVLKIDADNLTPAEFGDSSKLEVGDSAVAIGNPLGFDLFGTLTVGYISGLGREVAINDTTIKLIQTDAAINSGNSGGPLINECGQVIGITSMKLSNSYNSSSASIEGLAFAIPIDQAKGIIDDLLAYGYVTGRPQLGISFKNLSASAAYYYSGRSATSGVMVTGVNDNGPADKAGIKVDDIIVGADEKLVTGMDDLKEIIGSHNAGDTIKLTVIRDGRYYDVKVTLEDNKPDESAD